MASQINPSQHQNTPFELQNILNPSTVPLPPSASQPNFVANSSSSSSSSTTSTGAYPFQSPQYMPYPPQEFNLLQQNYPGHANLHQMTQRSNLYPTPTSHDPNSGGARLMALLGSQNLNEMPQHSLPFSQPEFSMANNSPTGAVAQSSPMRLLSSKAPKGRHLNGEHVVYDIDISLAGEAQPQLEVTPITKYASDPGLVLGRQIAVNTSYICYGLKMGSIRVLNINTALRALLRGHSQRVSDMAFFAEDVHLLASVSIDGRIYIWKINEGPDEEGKAQITEKVILSIQILGEEGSVHPRLCWHPHKQEILMVAIGERILKIDTIKVGKAGVPSAEDPLKCPLDKLIDGVQIVGKHDGMVTDISMCQWMTSRLASASMDGTVKLWGDRKPLPLAVLRPHDGDPVSSVTFLTAPHQPEHIVLFTGGPLNREIKVWISGHEEGWLLAGDTEVWNCIQTLELKSSRELKIEDAFFNQVVALPHAGLILLANAKKNAIYALHIDYGTSPSATCIDYIAEFTVTMPILSITGTSEGLPNGDHVVQIYCIQTQAIQQYALALSQCLPPPLVSTDIETTGNSSSAPSDAANSGASANLEASSGAKHSDITSCVSASVTAKLPNEADHSLGVTHAGDVASEITGQEGIMLSGLEKELNSSSSPHNAEFPLHASPSTLEKSQQSSGGCESYPSLPGHVSERPVGDNSTTRVLDNADNASSSYDNLEKDYINAVLDNTSAALNPALIYKHPTHLVTPSEILANTSETQVDKGMNVREAKLQNVVVNNDLESEEVEVKVVGEARINKHHVEEREKYFYSQSSDLSIQMRKDRHADTFINEGSHRDHDISAREVADHNPSNNQEEIPDLSNNLPGGQSAAAVAVPTASTPPTKGKKQKGKNTQAVAQSCPSPSPFNSADSSNEPSYSLSAHSADSAFPQILAMQEMIGQLMSVQKEMQKQMNTIVSLPFNKESRRLETSLGRNMEKVMKANTDALWTRLQEENAKSEKLERDRMQQVANLITNCINKDLQSALEKLIKKEITAVAQAVVRAITPILEKSISSAITESFQKGVADKATNQIEKAVNSRLETIVAKQIQSQLQTSGKQVLQDTLRSSLEASVIPTFESSCKTMLEQIDGTLQKGLMNHATAAHQQFESAHSPLAVALRDALNSASSISRTLSGELADGQRKIVALATAGASSSMMNPLVTQLSNGPLAGWHDKAEAPVDPTKELSGLISEHKYEEAFTAALHKSDVSIVSWLCSRVDLRRILSLTPVPLSQGVLLALLQQLACDIGRETSTKVTWMTDVALLIDSNDPTIQMHVRPIFEQVYQILNHHRSLPTTSVSEGNSIRLLMHVINSVLMSCK